MVEQTCQLSKDKKKSVDEYELKPSQAIVVVFFDSDSAVYFKTER